MLTLDHGDGSGAVSSEAGARRTMNSSPRDAVEPGKVRSRLQEALETWRAVDSLARKVESDVIHTKCRILKEAAGRQVVRTDDTNKRKRLHGEEDCDKEDATTNSGTTTTTTSAPAPAQAPAPENHESATQHKKKKLEAVRKLMLLSVRLDKCRKAFEDEIVELLDEFPSPEEMTCEQEE